MRRRILEEWSLWRRWLGLGRPFLSEWDEVVMMSGFVWRMGG